jgi:hypothetical protein
MQIKILLSSQLSRGNLGFKNNGLSLIASEIGSIDARQCAPLDMPNA